MGAVAIAKERTPAELRALARRERDGRAGRGGAGGGRGGGGGGCGGAPTPGRGGGGTRRRGPPAWTGRPCATGCTATMRQGSRACATGRAPPGPAASTRVGRRP